MKNVVIGLIQYQNKYAFLQRQDGQWTFPSGKKEPFESPQEACIRENQEETSLLTSIREYLGFKKYGDTHLYYFLCTLKSGKLQLMEPDKFISIEWKTADEIKKLAGKNLSDIVDHHFKSIKPPSDITPSL